MSGLGLTFLRRGNLAHPTAGSDYILSENRGDPEVFRILMANGVSKDGVGITIDDLAAITDIGTWFKGNTEIVSFKELEYCTSLKRLGYNNDSTAAFANCSNLREVAIPPSVNYIGVGCFMGCNLDEAPDISLCTTVRTSAFRNNYNMTGDVICNAEEFYSSTFANTSITSIEVNNATTFSSGTNNNTNGALLNCKSLEKIIIGESVTLIRQYSCYGCSALESVILRGETPPTLNSASAFYSTNETFIIYVPDASVDAYKAAANWSNFADRIKGISEYNG